MSDKKITIQGKQIDYGNMTDEQILKLFTKIKENELKIFQKVSQAEAILKKYNQ